PSPEPSSRTPRSTSRSSSSDRPALPVTSRPSPFEPPSSTFWNVAGRRTSRPPSNATEQPEALPHDSVQFVQSGPELRERVGQSGQNARDLLALPGQLSARLNQLVDVRRRQRSHRMRPP